MSHYKHPQRSILLLVIVFLFCANTGVAQTPEDTTPVRELAAKLLSAKTEDEQNALLRASPDLITGELVQALRKHAEDLTQRRELSQALIAL